MLWAGISWPHIKRGEAMRIIEPITLSEAKAHLRVEHSDEDAYITTLISVARDFAEKFVNRLLAERQPEAGENVPEYTFPTPAEKQAMLLLIGHFYEHREDVSPTAMYKTPIASKNLLNFSRKVPLP